MHSSKTELETKLVDMRHELAEQYGTVGKLQQQVSQTELQLAEVSKHRVEMKVEASEKSAGRALVQHAADANSTYSRKATEKASLISPAINWVIQQDSAPAQSDEGNNAVDDDDGSIEVYVHKSLL